MPVVYVRELVMYKGEYATHQEMWMGAENEMALGPAQMNIYDLLSLPIPNSKAKSRKNQGAFSVKNRERNVKFGTTGLNNIAKPYFILLLNEVAGIREARYIIFALYFKTQWMNITD